MALYHLDTATVDKNTCRSSLFIWAAVAIVLWAPHAVSSQEAAVPPGAPPADESWFEDLAASAGLTFTHFNGMTGQYWFPEMTGQGGAAFDYDGDGDLDLYLVQGSVLGSGKGLEDALFPPPSGQKLTDRLYRNDATIEADGTRSTVFVDVTDEAAIDAPGYGMGAAVGDFDDDGWPDLYVTNYGPNQLLRNRGDGTFEDVTAASGTGDPLWGTSATFFDYDGDGDGDLYLANYVTFDIDKNPRCFAPSSRRDYCGPDAFDAQPDRLFENRGGGVFEEVTSRVLVGYVAGPGLGVTAADFNSDGLVDLYVANDGRVNQLWIHQDDGTFFDDALFAGVAVNAKGRSEASMGIDAADFDGDGDEDIFITHLMGETNTLYVNDGTGLFQDWTVESGMASLSLPYTSFGTAWVDFDNDGALDLMAANGAVRILEDQAAAGDPYPLKQPNQLFQNVNGHFEDASPAAGTALSTPLVSRGLSVGDLDNDGDVDVVVHNNNGSTQLLVNRFGARQPWIGFGVRRPQADTWETGVRFESTIDAEQLRWRRARTDGSFCSASDPRVILGLGEAAGEVSGGDTHGVRLRVHEGQLQVRELRRLPTRRFVVIESLEGI